MKQLAEIQNVLKAPKGNFNSFGKYRYRSCEDILEAVKPLLAERGCTLTLTDDLAYIGERYYIKATATIKCGEEVESVTAFARESESKKGMDDSQITGTASSYARKYALNGLFLIDDTKDADTDEYQKQTKPTEKQTKPTEKPMTAYDLAINTLKLEVAEYAQLVGQTEKQVKNEIVRQTGVHGKTEEEVTKLLLCLRGLKNGSKA